jgi:hypothetical protein
MGQQVRTWAARLTRARQPGRRRDDLPRGGRDIPYAGLKESARCAARARQTTAAGPTGICPAEWRDDPRLRKISALHTATCTKQ